MKKISVIIPTFNRAKYICSAIDSVLAQSYKDFEIIVVDDGSTDNTKEALKVYGSRIKYVHQRNKGISAARNFGISKSNGDYVAFLDSDDLWYPDKLEKQIEIFERQPQIGLISTKADVIDESGKESGYSKPSKFVSADIKGMLEAYFVVTSSVLVKTNILKAMDHVFDETFFSAEDFDFLLRVVEIAKIFYLDVPLVKYRLSGDSTSKNLVDIYENRIRAIRKNMDSILRYDVKGALKIRLRFDYFCLSKEFLKKRKVLEFLKLYFISKLYV